MTIQSRAVSAPAPCAGIDPLLNAINGEDDVMIATRHTDTAVRRGDKLAGTRVIPLVIRGAAPGGGGAGRRRPHFAAGALDVGSSHSCDKPGEKLFRPEAAVEAEAELVKVTLQTLIARAMGGSQEKRLQIGDQGVYPAQSTAVLIKDLIIVDIGSSEKVV